MEGTDSKGLQSMEFLSENNGDAIMPVEKDAVRYNMNNANRGKAVIFNIKEFKHENLRVRNGSDVDRDQLETTLKSLEFEVSIYNNATSFKIREVLYSLSLEDHSNNDCLLIALFSHGEQNLIYSTDGTLKPDSLWEYFTAENCRSLAGKPKIFLLQACQGDEVDSGTKLRASKSRTATDTTDSRAESYRIPNRADFLIVYSTVPGYYSWRNTAEGSWFIQSFNDVVRKYAYTLDFLSMMTYVARRVALYYESNVPNSHMHLKKQVPYITSTLIREIHFTKKSS